MYFDVLGEEFDFCKIDKNYAVTDALLDFVSEYDSITENTGGRSWKCVNTFR